MITPTVIILLVLLFRDGTSHPVKAILVHLCFGLWLPIPELRTMLRSTALPFSSCGSSSAWWDFHPGGHVAITSFFYVLVVVLSLLCFEARVTTSD